jgi:propionate CoA-transferase
VATSVRPPTHRRSSTCPISSTSTTAAVWTRRSSGSRKPTGKATSTYRGSARGWPARAASSTSFAAGDLQVSVVEGKLLIERDGQYQKFVEEVEHRTFSGPHAARQGKDVLYITERCVFRRTTEGLELTEVAPGIDIERDILAKMAFKPIVTKPREMDRRIFRSDPMGLREDMLRLPLDARFSYDDERNILYLNFEDLQVKSTEVIEEVVAKIREICGPLGHKVYAVVNYDGFELDSDLEDAYLDAVQEIDDTYFHGVTRFTTSAFMRVKLGSALESRGVAPHIYESEDEAAGAVRASLPRQE